MSEKDLRGAAEVLRQRAHSVRRPFGTQEKVDVALADALDHAADHFYDYNAPHLDTVAALILGES